MQREARKIAKRHRISYQQALVAHLPEVPVADKPLGCESKWGLGVYPGEPVVIALTDELEAWISSRAEDCQTGDDETLLPQIKKLRAEGRTSVRATSCDRRLWIVPVSEEGFAPAIDLTAEDPVLEVRCEQLAGEKKFEIPYLALCLPALPGDPSPWEEEDVFNFDLLAGDCRVSGIPLPGRSVALTKKPLLPPLTGLIADLDQAEEVTPDLLRKILDSGIELWVRVLNRAPRYAAPRWAEEMICENDPELEHWYDEAPKRRLFGVEEGARVNVTAKRGLHSTMVVASETFAAAAFAAAGAAAHGIFVEDHEPNVLLYRLDASED